MSNLDLKNRLFGVGHRIFTIIGSVAGLAVGLSDYLGLIPVQYQSAWWYVAAVGFAAWGAWWKKKMIPAITPAALALLVAGALAYAPAVRAQEVMGTDLIPEPAPADPTLIPALAVCNLAKTTCLAPAIAIVPYVLDFDTGSIGRNQRILFQFGEGLTVVKGSVGFGGDFLVGTSDSGGWNAALLGKVGPKGGMMFRLGPVVEHTANGYHWSLGIGGGF